MASFAPLHTGQFIVKPRALRRRRTLWVSVALLAVLLPYVTFELGRSVSGYSVLSSQRARLAQAAKTDTLQNELGEMRRELGSARLGRKVEQQSSDSMQQSLADLQATIQRQQEEITFYKAIVTPANAPQEPQVQRFEVEPDAIAPHRYRLRLVLIQSMQATGNASGTMQLRVSGMRQGEAISLPLTEVVVDKAAVPLKFAYRYFQTLEPLIELPADFQPSAVQVELHAAQRAVQRQEFVWQPRVL